MSNSISESLVYGQRGIFYISTTVYAIIPGDEIY